MSSNQALTPTSLIDEIVHVLKKLIWPTLTLALILVPGWRWLGERQAEAKDITQRILGYLVGVGLGLSIAWLMVRLIEVVVWRLLELRLRAHVPRLLKDIVAATIFVIAGFMILGLVFKQSVTGIWATSGIVSLVVGFALRNMIADVFCGIALNVDQPFKIGQWIKIHPRGMPPIEGAVLEISWRSTRMRTMGHNLVVVPNSEISTMVVTNYSEPQDKCRFDIPFCLDFEVPPERAVRVLLAGCKAASGVLETPSPTVNASKVSGRGVEYMVRFWMKPAEMNPEVVYHTVITNILRHLHQAGISLAYEKHDIFYAEMPPRQLDRLNDRAALVKRIEIFSTLQQDETERLANRIKERRFRSSAAIVNQGDPGDSMFVLVEGLLEVRSILENGKKQVRVKTLEPGEFFGEMSLLTGEPRAATVAALTDTVVYEIGKEDLELLLASRPEIAVNISQIVAQRRQDLAALEKLSPEEKAVAQQSFAEQILDKMKSVFSSLRHSLGLRQRQTAMAK